MVRLFPSLIASNPLTLEKTLLHLRDICNGFHIDIMDGQFVPNLAFSVDTVNAIRGATPLILWIHLMVYKPEKYIQRLALQEHDIVSVHYEACPEQELIGIFKALRQKGVAASCALNPQTPVSVLEPLIPYIDQILIMSVQPGLSGQQFIPETVAKLQQLAQLQHKLGSNVAVGVDGGINMATMQEVLHQQATDIALGASVFFGNKPVEKLQQFLKII